MIRQSRGDVVGDLQVVNSGVFQTPSHNHIKIELGRDRERGGQFEDGSREFVLIDDNGERVILLKKFREKCRSAVTARERPRDKLEIAGLEPLTATGRHWNHHVIWGSTLFSTGLLRLSKSLKSRSFATLLFQNRIVLRECSHHRVRRVAPTRDAASFPTGSI